MNKNWSQVQDMCFLFRLEWIVFVKVSWNPCTRSGNIENSLSSKLPDRQYQIERQTYDSLDC